MRSLLANSLAMLAARLIVPALSFAINVGIARLCGPEVLGGYVHLLALAAIFQTAAAAGLTSLLTRELAAHPEDAAALLRRARTLGAMTGLLATAGFVATAALVTSADRLIPAALLATSILPSAWIAVQESFFMASRTHHRITLVALVENALKLGLAVATFHSGGGLALLCAGVAAARVAALVFGGLLVSRAGVRASWRPVPLAETAGFARAVAPFAVLLVLSMTYFKLDVLLVEALLGPGPTGVYGAALALYSVALLVPESVMGAVYPRLAARHRESSQAYAQATRVAVRLVTAGLVPLALGLICFADVLLRVAYGGRYAEAAPVLRLLAASLPLHAANGALGQALQAGRLQGPMVRIVFAGLGAHAALCALLVPRLGITGAPIAILASSLVVTVGAALVFHREVSPLVPAPAGLLATACIVGPIALTLAAPAGWTYIAGAVGLLALAAAARGLLITEDDRTALRQAMRPTRLGPA